MIVARSIAIISTNTSCRADRACRADFVRRNSGWQLDAVDKISFWRCHRIDGENWFAWLDTKTVRRLVAASDFQPSRSLDFLVGFNREFLARRSSVARQTVRLANSRSVVRRFFAGFSCGSDPRIEKTSYTFHIPTTGNCNCNFDCCQRELLSWGCFQFNSILAIALIRHVRIRISHRAAC